MDSTSRGGFAGGIVIDFRLFIRVCGPFLALFDPHFISSSTNQNAINLVKVSQDHYHSCKPRKRTFARPGVGTTTTSSKLAWTATTPKPSSTSLSPPTQETISHLIIQWGSSSAEMLLHKLTQSTRRQRRLGRSRRWVHIWRGLYRAWDHT